MLHSYILCFLPLYVVDTYNPYSQNTNSVTIQQKTICIEKETNISHSVESYDEKAAENFWKLLRRRKPHSFQTIKDIDH